MVYQIQESNLKEEPRKVQGTGEQGKLGLKESKVKESKVKESKVKALDRVILDKA
jgi:hypothetical protein